MNLYRYAENDPVRFVDPSGLRIQVKRSALFQNQTNALLNQIAAAGPRGNKLVNDLRASRHTITIYERRGGRPKFVADWWGWWGKKAAYLRWEGMGGRRAEFGSIVLYPVLTLTKGPGSGCGGRIPFDPSLPSFGAEGTTFTPAVSLAHELGHAWRFDQGRGSWVSGVEEVSTAVMENSIREELRLPRRQSYSLWEVPTGYPYWGDHPAR
jgi:hypothetical protein